MRRRPRICARRAANWRRDITTRVRCPRPRSSSTCPPANPPTSDPAGRPLMESQLVLVEQRGRVGLLTLNRPQALNALNDALMDELGAALMALDADDGVGALVLAGSTRAFAAGADISAMKDLSFLDAYRGDYITRNWEVLRRVRKPVIAA